MRQTREQASLPRGWPVFNLWLQQSAECNDVNRTTPGGNISILYHSSRVKPYFRPPPKNPRPEPSFPVRVLRKRRREDL